MQIDLGFRIYFAMHIAEHSSICGTGNIFLCVKLQDIDLGSGMSCSTWHCRTARKQISSLLEYWGFVHLGKR
jgi:hypothetical protein